MELNAFDVAIVADNVVAFFYSNPILIRLQLHITLPTLKLLVITSEDACKYTACKAGFIGNADLRACWRRNSGCIKS